MADLPLEAGEEITLRSYRHWINLVPVTVSASVLLVGAAVLSYAAGRHPKLAGTVVPTGAFLTIALVLMLIAVALYLAGWWVYRHNLLVLTNLHLIKVEQNGLFANKVSQLSLSRVQDVNGSRNGIVATILNYGRVEVQTAGEEEEFVFIQMPHPSDLANRLVKAHDQYLATTPDDGLGGGAPTPTPTTPPTPRPADIAPQTAELSVPTPPSVPEPEPATPEPPAPIPEPEPSTLTTPPNPPPANEMRTPPGPQTLVENQPADLDPPTS